jgi:hypothetical protein
MNNPWQDFVTVFSRPLTSLGTVSEFFTKFSLIRYLSTHSRILLDKGRKILLYL